MGGADAIATRIATTDDEHILPLGRDALFFRKRHPGQHAVLLREQFEGEVHALQFTAGDIEVAGAGRAGGDDDGVGLSRRLRQCRSTLNVLAVTEGDAFLLHQPDAPVDNRLVELEVWDAVAQQSAGGLVLLIHRHRISHLVEGIGTGQAGRTGTDDGDALPAAPGGHPRLDIPLAEGGLDDGALVLAVGRRLVVEAVQHAGLLAQRRTDAARELGEGIGARQQTEGLLPLAPIQRVVPLWRLVAQRTSPMAEGHAAVHAARGLPLAFAGVERLLHLAKVVDAVVHRTVARLLTVYL